MNVATKYVRLWKYDIHYSDSAPLPSNVNIDPTYPRWENQGWLNKFVAKCIVPRVIQWIGRDEKSRNNLIAALNNDLRVWQDEK
jgi:hypothetical protein